MQKGAIISECGKYRYRLWRVWDEAKPQCMFIMLNPSTADADQDDPTIRRCIGFAKSWGYGGIQVCNLFAYRATNPGELLKVNDPIGPVNARHVHLTSDLCGIVVLAWGNGAMVRRLLDSNQQYGFSRLVGRDKVHCIRLTKDGTPSHPLYLPKNLTPITFYFQ